MAVRNVHFYSRNEGTSYPLDDAASTIDDRGGQLLNSVLVDANIRWPDAYGRYAFVSSVTVTPAVVSVTIQAATDLDDPIFSPLAVVTVPQPVTVGRQYALEGQVDGVGGWVVFGRGVQETYRGRFSTPRQGLLTARTARAYRSLPITGVRSLDSGNLLRGIVQLNASPPLELARETREIDGVLRDCVVIRLVEDAGLDGIIPVDADGNVVQANDVSVFRQFGGPCSGRPESGSCGDPQPIEFVDVVGPDCDGVLTVEFRGCAEVYQIEGVCGIAVDCGFGLSAACLPPFIPDNDGKLPSEYDPVVVTPPDPETPDPDPDLSETIIPVGELPYYECFRDGEAQDFVVKQGLWVVPPDETNLWKPCVGEFSESLSEGATSDDYAYASNTAAGRCLVVWAGFDFTTLRRRCVTEIKFTQGPFGAAHNAGLVINYRPHATLDNRFVYHYAEFDYDQQQVRLSRFNGSHMQTAAAVATPGLLLEKWYRITVDTEANGGNTVNLTARFESMEDDSVDVTIGPVGFNNFYPSDGYFGFGTDRAVSRFAYLQVEEL